jgi:ATP-binding cassette subfamily C protein CydD
MIDKRLRRQLQPARIDFGLTIIFGFLAAISLAGQAFFLSRTIAQVFLKGASLAEVQPFLLCLLGLSLLRAGLVWAGQVTAQRLATQVKNDLRERLTGHLLALGPAYSRNERSGELANTAVEGVEALDPYFNQYLPQLVMAVLAPVAILLFIFPLDITSGFILLMTAPLIPIFMLLFASLAK